MLSLDRLKRWLYYRITKRRAHRHPTSRQFYNLESARKIGVLYEANQIETVDMIQSFQKGLRDENKAVTSIGYINRKEVAEARVKYSRELFLTPEEINWCYIPKAQSFVKSFIMTDFDLLLNLYTRENLPLQYISTLSKAQLRVGTYQNEQTLQSFDFLIQVSANSNNNIEFLLHQVKHYLQPQKKPKSYV